ncbi:sugar transferase [Halpernia frigidisoli]|uniref:Sugar transferase involved in LPS biosynthesis (Colanic, teichoic acid) n=1 Tax=Halpernia frigidisoli TaxID=1125876 RepID=A0A1I3FCE6_9FLAO|nr:sugar transferase [Halpernia frigidisoli]SFI08885.1 Sugar transferase involved in LPS biosynthesis (colanic, teichoic acid) [Halpernia frigidisoli]
MYKSVIKPLADFIFSVVAFIILLPVFLIITIFLIICNRGNPFFFQRRPGKNDEMFFIVKFKTMTNQKDKYGHLLPDENRTTKLGKIIRQTSLDEIPQLLNVIKGDMSFVGPRPLLPEYLPLYNSEQKKRHLVKPGITGWAQINGRNAISWEKKFELDVWYVENLSFFTDLKIIIFTIKKVLISHGIYQETGKSVDVFKGSSL